MPEPALLPAIGFAGFNDPRIPLTRRIFEIGAQINRNRNGLVYIPPTHKRTENLFFGEDEFFLRALRGVEPEHSEWTVIMEDVEPFVSDPLPHISGALQKPFHPLSASSRSKLLSIWSPWIPNFQAGRRGSEC